MPRPASTSAVSGGLTFLLFVAIPILIRDQTPHLRRTTSKASSSRSSVACT
jgi:hypothetical protein